MANVKVPPAREMSMTFPPSSRSLWFLALLLLLGCDLTSAGESQTARDQGPCQRNEDCKNGGTCVVDPDTVGTLNPVNKCQCADHYWGPKCNQYCSIKCYNGGTCRFTSDVVGNEHVDGHDTNPDHHVCECPTGWGGRQCQATVVVCPDNTQCFNGGICIVSSENTASYTCSCPEQGDPENRCGDLGEYRPYAKGPVREIPVNEGGFLGIIVALVVAVVAVALVVRMMRRRRHTRVMTEAFEEVDIDELRERMNARVLGYRDDVEEEDDSGIAVTEIM